MNNNTDIFDRTKLFATEILELLPIGLDAILFVSNNKYYRQIKGTSMGSPASIVIAEIVMQKSRRNDYVKSRKLSRILVSICR